jgi:hypothetical protein
VSPFLRDELINFVAVPVEVEFVVSVIDYQASVLREIDANQCDSFWSCEAGAGTRIYDSSVLDSLDGDVDDGSIRFVLSNFDSYGI